MSRRDPLDVLLDAAAARHATPRTSRELDDDVARAVLIASARDRRAAWARSLAVAAAALLIGVSGTLGLRGLWVPAAPEAPRTAAQEASTRITLARGDVVFSDAAARLDVHDDGAARRVVLAEGDVLFDVAPLGEGASFVVDAEHARVRVTGTVFAVTRRGEGVRVTVFEGSVVAERGGASHALSEGESWATDASAAVPSEAIVREGERRAAARRAHAVATVVERVEVEPSGAASGAGASEDVGSAPRAPEPRASRAAESGSTGSVVRAPEAPASDDPADVAPPSVAELRRRLLAGEQDAVLAALARDARRGRDLEIDLLCGDAFRAAHRFEEAMREYESVAARSSPSRAAEAGFLAASVALRSLHDPSRALEVVARTHADADGSPVEEQATALRARAEHALGRSEAATTARRYLARFPGGVAREEMERLTRGE